MDIQNSEIEGETAQSIIHRCLWQPEIAHYIKENTFHQYAAENNIENVQVNLEVGDLYSMPDVSTKSPVSKANPHAPSSLSLSGIPQMMRFSSGREDGLRQHLLVRT